MSEFFLLFEYSDSCAGRKSFDKKTFRCQVCGDGYASFGIYFGTAVDKSLPGAVVS